MASFLAGLASGGTKLDIKLHEVEKRTKVDVRFGDKTDRLPLYMGNDTVRGMLEVNLSGKKLDHQGIRIEFVGSAEVSADKTTRTEFTYAVKELADPGTLTASKAFPFEFPSLEKPYESYNGVFCRVRYVVRASISQKYAPKIKEEQELWVQNNDQAPEMNNPIKMEVGVEDTLHIEFEYTRNKYHLRDVVIGKIFFLLVRIPIKVMEVSLIRTEVVGVGANKIEDDTVITKFEIMDGDPVRGESIPVRLFLGGLDVCPTMKNVSKLFSIKWTLNLTLFDMDDRRYFKKQEVILWRKPGQV